MSLEQRYTATEYVLAYDGFEPREEGLRETLTSTGGYFCIRGAAEPRPGPRTRVPPESRAPQIA